ncbi:MAG: non-canonical purine NTP pyrophosphatase, RdgB/HAM1 family [Chloroflexi bacterium]|nr:non-canonical purine NTP pyrophosphatase, RdgB/HAM1 family [Chloroflexota bacterium]
MNHKLLLGTSNPGKIKEFKQILQDIPYELTTLEEASCNIEVIETGKTFLENATLKATQYAHATKLPCISDDSGIEIDALNGRPGIYSARYGGPDLSDSERGELILEEMKNISIEKRQARFKAAIVIAWPNGKILNSEGTMEGIINFSPTGENGFGYDPIFLLPEFGKTSAEINPDEKNKLSHRAKAIRNIIPLL